MKDLVGAMEKG